MKKKGIALVMAVALLVVATVGGTLAWLTDSTDEVTNTFTKSNIDVTLIETMKPDGTVEKDGVTDWSAQIIPGYSYSKNPTVSVSEDSVDCYLFVKFEVDENNCLTYTSTLSETGSGWTQGTGNGTDGNGVPTNVWYRVVKAIDSTRSWNLLENNTVTISDELTKEQMPNANVTLKYTAYACQYYKNNNETNNTFTPKDAWQNASKVAASGN